MKGFGNPYNQLNNTLLTECGLNMQAVFSVTELPLQLRSQVNDLLEQNVDSGSLLLLGNGGRQFWDAMTPAMRDHSDPLDQRSVDIALQYVQQCYPECRYQVLYPSTAPVGLQQLGKLAGWHGDSPLKVGINPTFGLWYAYRALLWVEADLVPTPAPRFPSPCESCLGRPCINACPANALSENAKALNACIDFRLLDDSSCQFNCLARMQCPVAAEHRYSTEQIHYHYQQSYETLVRWRQTGLFVS